VFQQNSKCNCIKRTVQMTSPNTGFFINLWHFSQNRYIWLVERIVTTRPTDGKRNSQIVFFFAYIIRLYMSALCDTTGRQAYNPIPLIPVA
jgi:hypothetical protein